MSEPTRVTLSAGSSSLTLDSRGQLTFLLDGQRRWQASSLCLLHYYDRQHPRAQQVVAPWDDSHTFGTAGTLSLSTRSHLDLIPRDDRHAGIRITFDSIALTISLSLTLAEDGQSFALTCPADGIDEQKPHLYRTLGLEILPEFGAARTGEQGYLTLPNWCGCQTFFDKQYPREARQTVYSSNDQWEHVCNAPVFGITRAQGTLCGLIAQGDCDAQLVCRVDWEAAQANSVHPCLIWRWQQEDDLIAGPREVRYHFAHPDDPTGEGYAFIGRQYRDFLRAERGLLSWDEKRQARPAAVDFASRFCLKIFMAYKDPHPEGKGEYHCTCTCDEARQVLEQCLARGMSRLTVILVGWGQDGHDGKCPTYLPVDARVGGDDAMRRLVAWGQANGLIMCVHTSHNAAYPCSDEFEVDDLIRHRSGEYWESIIWSGGQAHRICPSISLKKHVKRDLPRLAKLGFAGHHHYDAVGGFVCCYSAQHPVRERAQYIGLVREEFKVAQATMGSVSTEMPFGQYFDLVDGYWHSMTHVSAWLRNCPVGRWFLDRTVPLLGVALHDSLRFGESIGRDADQQKRMLHLLDYGLAPNYEVCIRRSPAFGIPTYAESADALAEAYRLAYGENGYVSRLQPHAIVSREEPAPGVSRTTYSDGTEVIVNRGEQPWDGVQPNGYRIGPATPG